MSHLALRRVTIRLLHDSAFAAALYADPERTLAGLDLTPAERAWLLAVPPAGWRTDPARPERVLAALAEEFPVSVARAPAHAAAFLASPAFHAAVQERGSLALAFGDHLAAYPDPAVSALARLERAVAAIRRAPRRPAPSPPGRLRSSPRAIVLRLPRGALALFNAELAMLDAARRGATGGGLGGAEEAVLVALAPGATDVTLEPLEPALASLLERAGTGVEIPTLLAELGRLGADPGEETVILDRLVADGLLL